MKLKLPKRSLAMLTWVALLIAVPSGVYVSHVFDQLQEVRENNLRTLSKAAETTNDILLTALGNVRNLENNADFVCEFVARQPYLVWSETATCEKKAGMAPQFRYTVLAAGTDGVNVRVPAPESGQTGYAFKVRLDSLLAAIPFSDTLDLLFLADSDGNVIHQHRPRGRANAGLLVSSLDGLPGVDGGATVAEELKRASSISRIRLSGTDYQLLCQPLTLPAEAAQAEDAAALSWALCGLVASERSLRQSLAVAPFLAFTFFAVTVFGFLTWPAMKLWWMTRRDRLYFVDLVFLLFGTFGGLLLATILVLGIGSYRQLVAGTDGSLEQLAVQIENNLQQEIDSLVTALGLFDGVLDEAVECGMAGDPAAGQPAVVEDLIDLYGKKGREGRPRSAEAGSCDTLAHAGETWEMVLLRNWRARLAAHGAWPLPTDLEMLFWAACDGQQLYKATVRDTNTPRVNVGERAYFNAALQDRLWRGGDIAPAGRYVEPLRSITTGKFATVVSMRSSVNMKALAQAVRKPDRSVHDFDCGDAGVVALQALLVATSTPVLPPGVGFALLDDEGTALLHSDERRALFENLYEEMEDGDRLRSIVLARSSASMNSSYLGRPHRVFVRPLAHTPWTVVTFSDSELLSTGNLEILGHAALIALVYLVFNALLAWLYFLWRGAEIPLWLWPGSHNPEIRRYSVGLPLAVFLFALLLLPGQHLYGDAVLAAVFLVPFAIFAGIYMAYSHVFRRAVRPDDATDVDRGQLRSGILSSFIVWLAIAVVPAVAFFHSALDNQAKLLTRYENEYLVDRYVQRNCTVDEHYRSIDRDGLRTAEAGQRRRSTAGDLYPSTIFWPKEIGEATPLLAAERFTRLPRGEVRCATEESRAGSLWSYITRNKPIYNPTVLRSRYLDPDGNGGLAKNACWSWQSRPDDRAEFTAAPLACGTEVRLLSGLPLQERLHTDPWVVGTGLVLLAVLWFWSRFGARTVFFGELRRPPLYDRQWLEGRLATKALNSKVRLIAIAASQHDRSCLLRDDGADCGNGAGEGLGVRHRYDMLDFLAGSAKREQMLEKLRADLEAGTNVLIVSPVDPYGMLNDADVTDAVDPGDTTIIRQARDRQEEIRQWREVLSHFRIVIVSINTSPPSPVSTGIWKRELDSIVDEQWLRAELDALPELSHLYPLLEPEVVGSTRRNALDRIVERCYGSFLSLWDACTEEEKLVLVQLASENVVNPKQVATVRRLIQRGLLVRDPGLRIMNHSFASFITVVQDPSEVSHWEQKAAGLSWTTTRWAVLGILTLGLLFLWATQRELFNTTMLFLSTAAVSLPGIVKLLSNLSKVGTQREG